MEVKTSNCCAARPEDERDYQAVTRDGELALSSLTKAGRVAPLLRARFRYRSSRNLERQLSPTG